MTLPRNLGPLLAIAGLAVVVLACVAGFIAVGGPGDARADRQDVTTMQHIAAVANAAQCGYARTGIVPKTRDQLDAEAALDRNAQRPFSCEYVVLDWIKQADAVDYNPSGPDRIRVCADFVRATKKNGSLDTSWTQFRELEEPRPIPGRHCFDIHLLKPEPPTPAGSPSPPDPPPGPLKF